MRIVVVGASLAGVRTVQALRRQGSEAHITLIGAEPSLACDRPPLSKTYLSRAEDAPRQLITDEQLADLDIELLLGEQATDLDLSDRSVGLSGARISYDSLVIATGSTPRILPGLEPRPGVHILRTGEHATAIRDALTDGTRVVIVGGGFIGAEVAWGARALGCDVTVVEPLPTLMVRGLGPSLGEVFTRRHADSGVQLRLGVGVAGIEGDGQVEAVRLSDGRRLEADVVIVGIGTTPETSWLTGSGLDLTNGVLCDEHLAVVGAQNVYAAGDVARWQHPRYGEPIRVEHWTNAVEHAPIVAANLCGTPTPYTALPYVWSDQLGARLQIVGRVQPDDDLRYVFGGPDEPKFAAVTGSAGELHAVVGFGAIRELMPFRQLLVSGGSWQAALELAGVAA